MLWKFAVFFASLGGFGLLLLGILDSSFLFLPLGNDLLVVVLTARHHDRVPYYAAMAAAGSVMGCFITDWISRKGGEKGLEQNFRGRSFQYVQRKIKDNAAWALAVACLLPPPFPFTPFVIVMAAMQYSRRKLLGIVAAGRLLRFSVEGALAVFYGRDILRMAKNSTLQHVIIALIVISLTGSVWSIISWIRRGRSYRHNKKSGGNPTPKTVDRPTPTA